jgi:RimJ/RimL family protein N-acetyltransferase
MADVDHLLFVRDMFGIGEATRGIARNAAQAANAAGLSPILWKPTLFQVRPPGVWASWEWTVYWLLDRLGIFARGRYRILRLVDETGRTVFYAAILPTYWRTPFIARDEVQIGPIRVLPDDRGKGLAPIGVGLLLASLEPSIKRVWYITRSDNARSIALAAKTGFRSAGEAVRIGASALSRFVRA